MKVLSWTFLIVKGILFMLMVYQVLNNLYAIKGLSP